MKIVKSFKTKTAVLLRLKYFKSTLRLTRQFYKYIQSQFAIESRKKIYLNAFIDVGKGLVIAGFIGLIVNVVVSKIGAIFAIIVGLILFFMGVHNYPKEDENDTE